MTGFKNQSLKRLITGLFICLLGAGLAGHASAQSQRLYVTEGQIEPIPVAIADFTGLDGTPSDVGRQIAQIISEDLVSSGLFLSIDSAAFIAPPASPDVRPNFSNWTPIGAKGLLIGSAFLDNDGALQVEFALWDVVSQRSITEGEDLLIRQGCAALLIK